MVPTGTRLGVYEIVEPLDQGGMGEVTARATQNSIARWHSSFYRSRLRLIPIV